MTDHIPKSTRQAIEDAEWVASRQLDKRAGSQIVGDALETARHDLVLVLGRKGAAAVLRNLAAALEAEADMDTIDD